MEYLGTRFRLRTGRHAQSSDATDGASTMALRDFSSTPIPAGCDCAAPRRRRCRSCWPSSRCWRSPASLISPSRSPCSARSSRCSPRQRSRTGSSTVGSSPRCCSSSLRSGRCRLAALLSPFGKVADVGFIAVLFAAVWVRRFGPRGNALGMVAFISYFFALFLRAIARSDAGAGRRDRRRHRRHAVRADADLSRPSARRGAPPGPGAARGRRSRCWTSAPDRGEHDLAVLRRRLDRLGETALMIDDWLDRHDAAQSLSVTSEDLALRVFDAQIAMEQLASLLWALDPAKPSGPADSTTRSRRCECACRTTPSEDELRAARKSARQPRRTAPTCPARRHRDSGRLPSGAGAPGDPPHHHQRAG